MLLSPLDHATAGKSFPEKGNSFPHRTSKRRTFLDGPCARSKICGAVSRFISVTFT
jgi:hypothetical protein